MKQITFIFLFIFISKAATAQQLSDSLEKKLPKHEISIDVLELVASTKIKLSYDFLLNSSETIGLDVEWAKNDSNLFYEDLHNQFSFAANYKHFFSKKYAQGFYVKAFLKYKTGDAFKAGVPYEDSFDNYHSLNLGFGVGYKLVSKKNFFVDINTGLERKLLDLKNIGVYENSKDIVPYIGINIGKRF